MKTKLLFFAAASVLLVLGSCNDVKDEETGDEVKIEKSYEERVKEIEAAIRKSPEWTASVEKKAKEKNISLDSMILMDARWLVDEQDGKHKNPPTDAAPASGSDGDFEKLVKDAEEKIRSDKSWMESIEKKAKERNITVDSMIKVDARFIVTEQQKQKQ